MKFHHYINRSFRQFNGFQSKGGVTSGTERFTDGGVASKLGETERGLSRAHSEGRIVHLRNTASIA